MVCKCELEEIVRESNCNLFNVKWVNEFSIAVTDYSLFPGGEIVICINDDYVMHSIINQGSEYFTALDEKSKISTYVRCCLFSHGVKFMQLMNIIVKLRNLYESQRIPHDREPLNASIIV